MNDNDGYPNVYSIGPGLILSIGEKDIKKERPIEGKVMN